MKRSIPSFLAGLFCGVILFSGGAAMAAGLTANPSRQTIYVDGKKANLTAYSILGSNYVKLRDIGRAVDFGVVYDAATNTVYVESDQPYVEEVKTGRTTNADGSINVPSDGSQYIPKEGDVIRCDDGSNYTIRDVRLYGNSMFAEGPLPPLPTPTCDWSQFPEIALPAAETRHFQTPLPDGTVGDYLFIRNLYETRRMLYTVYNAIGANPHTWQNGKLVVHEDGNPMVQLYLTIPDGMDYSYFWPWRESEITKDFQALPTSRYRMEVWDVFKNGIYLRTEYNVAFS